MIRVLLVVGDELLVEELCDALASTYQDWMDVKVTRRLPAALERLQAGGIDAVVLDLDLPDCQGMEALGRVQRTDGGVPIVVMISDGESTDGVDALARGARDYVIKGLDRTDALLRALRFAIVVDDLESRLNREQRTVRLLADASADAVVVMDEQGVVHYANGAAERLFGRAADQLVGQTIGLPLDVDSVEINVLREVGGALQPVPVALRSIETSWDGRQAHLAWLRDISSANGHS